MQPSSERDLTSGVVASVVASVLFGVLFFLPPLLDPLDGNAIFSWRLLVTVPVVVVAFSLFRQWGDFKRAVRRVKEKPALIVVVIINAYLLGIQVWLFGWTPQAGRGLEAALGYLLLPLIMVLVGVVMHRERLSRLRGLAVFCATAGVLAALLVAGGITWVTLLIAVGWPLCFASRRKFDLQGSGAFVLELIALLPLALWFVFSGDSLAAIAERPVLIPGVILLGLVGGSALVLYLAASRLLPFGLFGLLTYLEPLLLVVVSILLLGERLVAVDVFVYGPILLALVLLGFEPFRRPTTMRGPSGSGDR